MKFDDAAIIQNGIFKRNINADEVSHIRKNDEYAFQKSIKPYLYCPECKHAILTHCDGDIKQPYFKKITSSNHSVGCSNNQGALSSTSMQRLYEDSTDSEDFNKRLHRIIGLLYKGEDNDNSPFIVIKNKNHIELNTDGYNNEKNVEFTKKNLPRKLISRISETDIDIPKIFYGDVFIKWDHPTEKGKAHFILIYKNFEGKNFKNLLCRVKITEKVFHHIPLYAKCNQHCFIAFLSELSMNIKEYTNMNNQKYMKKYFNTYLISSKYLAIEQIDMIL